MIVPPALYVADPLCTFTDSGLAFDFFFLICKAVKKVAMLGRTSEDEEQIV
jgi:hypothetical protein